MVAAQAAAAFWPQLRVLLLPPNGLVPQPHLLDVMEG